MSCRPRGHLNPLMSIKLANASADGGRADQSNLAVLVYALLIALNVASLALIWVLNSRLQASYEELSRAHEGWAQVHRRTAALSRTAREANEPVNGVFSSSLPQMERDRLGVAIAHFFKLVEAERAALNLLTAQSQSGRLLHNLNEGEERMRRMSDTAIEMFERIARRDKIGADALMALADRQYGEFLDVMAERDSMVDALQGDLFAQGESYRRGLGAMVVAATLLLGLLSVGIAVLGMRLAAHAQRAAKSAATSTAAMEQSQKDLRSANALLEDSLRRQRRFVADAAHQLRTPVAGIRLQVARALKAQSIEEMRPTLEQVDLASKQMSRLADQLLGLAKAEFGASAGAAPRLIVDLWDIARASVRSHLASAHVLNVDLGLGECAGPVSVMGVPEDLEEMLSNLVDNAVRYSSPDGTVTLRAGNDPSPYIEVLDDGPGIPMEERTRVTEPFYRTSDAKGNGSGLGLAIAKEIAEAHGGKLEILNPERGRGTRIKLVFPARHE